jgi:hypothetical protein
LKTIVDILGGTGAGKSTLGRALAGETGGVEYRAKFEVNGVYEPVVWSVFPAGFAVAGNIGSGSDAITSLLATSPLVEWLLAQRQVKTVIVNPIRTSRPWNVDFLGSLGARVGHVFLDISYEENVWRMTARRAGNGRVDMAENTLRNIRNFHRRAAGVAAYAEASLGPKDIFLRLGDADTLAGSVKKIRGLL